MSTSDPAAPSTPPPADVKPFNPKAHVIRVQGNREYLPVAARLVWFRSEHPDWGIMTAPLELSIEKQYAIFTATITNAEGRVMATATKAENARGFADFIEKAETGAVGRALAYCGYGTQFAPELAEGDRIADAPTGDREAAPVAVRAPAPPREAPRPVDPAGSTATDRRCVAPGCPVTLNPSQYAMSVGKFGQAVCMKHQRAGFRPDDTTAAAPPADVEEAPDDYVPAPPAEPAPDDAPPPPAPAPPPSAPRGNLKRDTPEPGDPPRAPQAQAQAKEQEAVAANQAAYLSFSKEAYLLGFDVLVEGRVNKVYSHLKIGPLIVRATACPPPPRFKDWYPPVALLETGKARLPALKAEDEAAARVAVPVGAPADDYDDMAEFSDPFAE